MSAREDLSHILSALEGQAVRVSFVDGEIYDLEIKSTAVANLTSDPFSSTLCAWQIRLAGCSVSRPGASPTAAASVWLSMVARPGWN